MGKTLKEVKYDPNRELEVKQLRESISSMYDNLVKDQDTTSVISEADFITGFLPYFCGEIPVSSNKEFISTWIGIAGTPNSEVAVVNDKQEEIFRVPALMPTKQIDTRVDGRFYNLIENYEVKSRNIPIIGQNYLLNEVEEINKEITSNVSTSKTDEERWNDIFKRYNKPLPSHERDSSEIILDDNDDSDLLEYD